MTNQSPRGGVNKVIQHLLEFLFVVNFSESLFAPILAVFVLEFVSGASLVTVGISVAIYAVVKSLVQLPLARALDKHRGEHDEFFVITVGTVLGLIYSLDLMFIREVWQLYALSAINGVAGACIMAAYYAMFSHHLDRKLAGFEWSLFSVGGLTLSAAAGGLIGGLMAEYLGFQVVFLSAGMLYALALAGLYGLKPHLQRA